MQPSCKSVYTSRTVSVGYVHRWLSNTMSTCTIWVWNMSSSMMQAPCQAKAAKLLHACSQDFIGVTVYLQCRQKQNTSGQASSQNFASLIVYEVFMPFRHFFYISLLLAVNTECSNFRINCKCNQSQLQAGRKCHLNTRAPWRAQICADAADIHRPIRFLFWLLFIM